MPNEEGHHHGYCKLAQALPLPDPVEQVPDPKGRQFGVMIAAKRVDRATLSMNLVSLDDTCHF
jgi:hypothetical protein